MRSLGSLALLLVSSCGARTDLGLPDASFDLDASRDAGLDASRDGGRDAGLDAPEIDACMPLTVGLTPLRAEVLFVLDRSTSMGWALTGPGGPGPTRWSILVDTLRGQLPRYEATTDMGLLLFPDVVATTDYCATAAGPQLAPEPDASASMLDLVTSTGPGGRTPTADAMASARRWFATHADRSRVRAVLLATDGAPNCNDALDARTCPCTGGAGLPRGGCADEPALCLDDARTVEEISGLARGGVPTYVIGIDGDPDPALSDVLTEMAVAGGRPNPLDPTRGYYSVRRPGDLAAAFDAIQSSIARCSFALETRVAPDPALVLTIDGRDVPRDTTHVQGWDWVDEGDTVILSGSACELVQTGAHTLLVVRRCDRRASALLMGQGRAAGHGGCSGI